MKLARILRQTGMCVHMVAKAALCPISRNAMFFVFMLILGTVCGLQEEPKGKSGELYPYLFSELFVDVYVLCAVLAVIPRRVRQWGRGVVCAVLYIVAIIDVWCLVRLGSTLNPSMLMLLGETNGNEASEFISTYITWDVLISPVGLVLLVMVAHMACACAMPILCKAINKHTNRRRNWTFVPNPLITLAGLAVIGMFAVCAARCRENKEATFRLMSYDNIGAVEHELTRPNKAVLYMPVYRLAFSIYANRLTAKQLVKLIDTTRHIRIDSCTFRSPDIVFIIGESYNRHHSQLYGYDMPTTPRQMERMQRGELTVFSDVISPWNLTSYVFKHMFSLYSVGDSGEWCDYPLFPELFKKAGYHVTFITNQFLPKAREAVYDFSGGFFLNNPELSKAQFSTRNTSLHKFDDGVLADYDSLCNERGQANLTILHLMGQHVTYSDRSPKNQKRFKYTNYNHRKLSRRGKMILAEYDNATLYNDSIIHQILRRFENREAIIIYMSDHGEECFGDDKPLFGRMHSAFIDYRLAREEFEIPFWIWRSEKYAKAHPDIDAEIKTAAKQPFMTDNVPQLLLYLGGISCPQYRSYQNPLSRDYDSTRQRIIKRTTNYDKLRKNYLDGKK